MDEQLSILIQLQEIDAAIRTRTEEKNRLPELIQSLERRRSENKDELDKVREALQTAQKNKRDRDSDLETGSQKVEKLKTRTSDIKTNKEYQALLKEIEAAERENTAVEDDILLLMEKIDAAAAQIAEAEKRANEEERTIAVEREQYEEKIRKIDEDLGGQEKSRKALASRIEPSVLNRYQKLIVTKSGTAVVEVRGESCSGCYMSIPPQVFVNVKKNDSIITCPNCHRILYYKEAIVQK